MEKRAMKFAMVRKALAIMLVACVASSHALWWPNWVLFGSGLALTAAGGGMVAVGGFETEETGFYRNASQKTDWVHTGEKTHITTLGVAGIAAAFMGLSVAGIAYFLKPFKPPREVDIRMNYAPYPSDLAIEPVPDIPLFAIPPEDVCGGFGFGLPRVEGLRLSMSAAGAYAAAGR